MQVVQRLSSISYPSPISEETRRRHSAGSKWAPGPRGLKGLWEGRDSHRASVQRPTSAGINYLGGLLLAFPLTTRITGSVPFGPVQSCFEIIDLGAGNHGEWRRVRTSDLGLGCRLGTVARRRSADHSSPLQTPLRNARQSAQKHNNHSQ